MVNKHGSQSAEQGYYISSATPTDSDVVLGMLWIDPDDGKIYRCTSLGPTVWTEHASVEANAIDYGLSFQAIVTTATSTTVFAASGLADKGNDFFTKYFAYVIRDDGGASGAPQGEIQPISDYVSSTGAFTHTAFTAQLAVDDEVIIIHPALAYLFGVAAPQPPTAKSIYDILHKDGSFTYDNTTDSLEALADALVIIDNFIDTEVAAIQTDLDNGTDGLGALKALIDTVNTDLGNGTDGLGALKTLIDTVNTDLGNGTDGLGALKTLLDTITAGVVVNTRSSTYDRLAGVQAVIEVSVTAAANAGATTVATITGQPCIIESIIVHADAAQTGDLTNAPVTGGASGVVAFLAAADTVRANLNAADKQVAWTGSARFATGKTIVITPAGTGATALDLTVTIVYRAAVDGGYLA